MLKGSQTVFILSHDLPRTAWFEPALAQVGSLPVLLRSILCTAARHPARIVVVVNAVYGTRIRRELAATGRLPKEVEWLEVPVGMGLSPILRTAGSRASRTVILSGTTSYHPEVFRMVHEWDGEAYAFEPLCSGKSVGAAVLSPEACADLADEPESLIMNGGDLHEWIARKQQKYPALSSPHKEIANTQWQPITCSEDRMTAERKLDGWLTKSTDGVFARMNRRVSIPISRQLIKYPITPNMVTFFTLALSVVGGAFFALGGYWNSVAGGVLGVVTSILDGCDGEVARLKLQTTKLGCWLDSLCDYAYYVITFAGITIGLMRGKDDPRFLELGAAVFFGAIMTFVLASYQRRRLSGARPEKYLEVWQKHAEKRSAGLLVNGGRYTEFIVRRCFLPYLLLVLALCNGMTVFLCMAAFGANVAWIVALRSIFAFSSRRHRTASAPAGSGVKDPVV